MFSLFLGVIGFGHVTANVIIFFIHVDTATNFRIATAFFALVGGVVNYSKKLALGQFDTSCACFAPWSME